jgi:hypothetical protein
MKTFVYKTINEEGDKIKSHNVNHQFELEDSIISAFFIGGAIAFNFATVL